MLVKATKTQRYAQKDPSAKQFFLIKDQEIDLPDELAKRVIELNGGVLIELSSEEEDSEDSELKNIEPPEKPELSIETKERGEDKSRRTPGRPKK